MGRYWLMPTICYQWVLTCLSTVLLLTSNLLTYAFLFPVLFHTLNALLISAQVRYDS